MHQKIKINGVALPNVAAPDVTASFKSDPIRLSEIHTFSLTLRASATGSAEFYLESCDVKGTNNDPPVDDADWNEIPDTRPGAGGYPDLSVMGGGSAPAMKHSAGAALVGDISGMTTLLNVLQSATPTFTVGVLWDPNGDLASSFRAFCFHDTANTPSQNYIRLGHDASGRLIIDIAEANNLTQNATTNVMADSPHVFLLDRHATTALSAYRDVTQDINTAANSRHPTGLDTVTIGANGPASTSGTDGYTGCGWVSASQPTSTQRKARRCFIQDYWGFTP